MVLHITHVPLPPVLLGLLLVLPLRPLAAEGDSEDRGPLPVAGVRRAAHAAASGNLSLARAELAALSEDEALLPQALLVQACIDLEAGVLEPAAHAIRALRARLPERPEPRVLESLLAVRRQQPDLGWDEAYLRAWNVAGRPDLRKSSLIMGADETPPAEPGVTRVWSWKHAVETRFVLALAGPPDMERVRFLVQALPSLDDAGLALAVHGHATQHTMPADLSDLLSATLRQQLPPLIATTPNSMDLRLLALLDGTSPDEPFTSEELQALEAIAVLPEWRQADFAELFERIRHHLEAAGVSAPGARAFTVAVSALAGQGPLLLRQRALASRDVLAPLARRRLGEALWQIGARMSAESTVLEYFVGLALQRRGAELLEDSVRIEDVAARHGQTAAAFKAWASAAPGDWPFPSLRQAVLDANVHDEMGHLHRYLAAP